MKKHILAQFNSPDLVLLAFLLFFFTFVSVAVWTWRKSGEKHYDDMSKAPLAKDHVGGLS